MSASVIIRLDLPPKELSPNARIHWHVKAAAVQVYRLAAYAAGINYRSHAARKTWPLKTPVRATIAFVVRTNRRRDTDNLLASIKPGLDGLVSAKILQDDSAAMLKLRPDVVVMAGKRPGYVLLQFEEAP